MSTNDYAINEVNRLKSQGENLDERAYKDSVTREAVIAEWNRRKKS